MKAITVAFDKADSYWYPKDIPVYPYRHNDLIEQCYLGTDKVTEFTDRPRKTSSPPKFLGRSHSQTTKDTIPTTHKKRIDRIRSSTHGISPSDLAISPREMNDINKVLTGEGLRLTSSAREIRQLREDDRLCVSENEGSSNSVRSAEVLQSRPLSSSMEDILKDSGE